MICKWKRKSKLRKYIAALAFLGLACFTALGNSWFGDPSNYYRFDNRRTNDQPLLEAKAAAAEPPARVTVTADWQHANGRPVGSYFAFALSHWTEVFGDYRKYDTSNLVTTELKKGTVYRGVEQWRDGALVWMGDVKVWPHGGATGGDWPRGRAEPWSAGEFRTGDQLKPPARMTVAADWQHENGRPVGSYFAFALSDWMEVFGGYHTYENSTLVNIDLTEGTVYRGVEQWRHGALVWAGDIKVWPHGSGTAGDWPRGRAEPWSAGHFRTGDQLAKEQLPPEPRLPPPEEFDICGRTAKFDQTSWSLQQKYYSSTNCPRFDPKKRKTLVLKGNVAYGRSGNQLRSFLRAVQYARDKRVGLAIVQDSWAMEVLLNFFMADDKNDGGNDGDWKSRMEQSLCVKIVEKQEKTWEPAEFYGRTVSSPRKAEMLFRYKSKAPRKEYVASQLQIMRTLFQHHNTGIGEDKAVKDMCSGIDSLFANDGDKELVREGMKESHRSSALYSTIHLRSLEKDGRKMLAKTAERTGCDPVAALEMKPEYIKSILAQQGMLGLPIVVISDNQEKSKIALARLLRDPYIGRMIRVVPKKARWIGGDLALAVMGNVFIGNPASTMSAFIAQSRVALGFEHNYLYLAKDDNGEYVRVHKVLGEVH